MYQGFDHRSCIEQLAQLKSKAEDILNRLDHLIRKGALDSSPLLQKFRRTFSETEKRLVKGFPADPDHVKLSTKEKYAKAELQHNSKPFMVQLWPFYSLLQEVHGFHLQARRFLFDLDSLCNSFSVHAWGLMQLFMDVVVRLIQMHHLAAQGPWPLLLQVYTLLHRYSNDGQNPSSRDALTLLVSEHYQALVPWLQASFQPLTRRIHQVIEMVCLPAMPLVLDASHPSSSCHLLQALAASSGTEPQPAAGSAAGGKTDALLEWPRPVLLHTEQIEEWLVLGLLICPEAGLDAQVLEALGRVLSQRLRLGLYRGGSLALHQQFAAHVVPGLLKAARKQPSRSLRGPKDLGKLLKSLVPSALAQAQAQAAAYHCRQMSFLQRQLEGLLQWCENQAGDLARVVPQLMAALHRSWREVQWCFRHMEHCTATLRGQAAMTWPGGAAAPEVLCCALLDRMVGCIGLLDVWRSGLRVSAMQEALHKLEASVLPSLEVGSRMLADQPESAHGGAAGVQAAEAALSELWSCMSAAQSHVRTCLSSLQALRPGTETRQPEGPSVAAEGGSQAEGGREDDDSSDDGVRDSGARWERPAALMLPEDEGEHDGSFGARVVQGSSFWLRRGAAGPLAAAEVAAVLDGGDGAAWSPERASQLRWEWRVGELRLVARCRGPDGRDVLLQGSFHQQLQLDRVLPALCEQPEVLLDCQEAVELLETAAHGPAEVARRRWAPLHDLACWPAAVRAVLQKALESGPRSCAAAVCLVHVHACPPHDTPEPAAVPPKPAAAPKPPKLPAGSAAGASEQATTAAGSVMLARQRTQQALEILDVLAGTLARLLQEAHEALKTKAQWVTLPWEAAAFAATSSAAAAPAGAGSGAPRLAWPGFAAGRNRAGKEAGLARLSPGLESCPGRSGVTLSLLADRLQSAAALLQSLDAASPVHVGADTAVQPRSAIPAALRLAAAGVLNRLAFGCGSRGGGRGGGRGAAGGADAALGALAGGGWELPPPSALAQELRLLLHMLLQLDQQVPGADLQMYAKEHLLGLSSPCSGCDAAEPPGLQELLGEPGSRGLCQEYVSWYIHAAVLDTAQLGATLSPTLRCFLAAEGGAADALLRQHTGIGELSCFAAVFGMGGVRLLAAATHAVLRDTLPDLLDACSQAAAEPATKGKPALRGGGSGARQNVKSVVSRAAAAPEPQAAAVVAQLARCLGLRAALAEAALAALSQHAPVLSTAVAAMHSGAAAAAAAPAASTPHSATQPSDLVAAWPLDLHEDRAGGPPAGAKPLQDAAQLPPARPPDMNGSGSSAQQATASTSVPFLPSLWQQLNLPEPAGALVSAPSRSAGSGSGTGGRAAAAAGSAQTPRSSGRRADPALVQILAAQGPGTMHVMVTSLARLAAAHPFSSSSAEHVVWNSGTGTASNGAHLLSVCMEAFAAALSALPLRPFPSDPALLASPDAAAATAAPAAAPSSLQAVFEAAVGHALVQQDASNAALRALSEQLALSCSSS